MAGMQRKSFRSPDERESFPKGESREVHLGELVVARTYQEPGWRWSTHVKPIVGTGSCRFHHTGVVLRGRARWLMDDGSELEFSPDDVFDIPPGDGVLAVFDGGERAVRAAATMHAAVEPLQLRIRAAVHTGEVEHVRGVAVHVAARMLALAGPGEVLVSSTTRDLLADQDLAFVDRGDHELKGVSGRRRLFALQPPAASR